MSLEADRWKFSGFAGRGPVTQPICRAVAVTPSDSDQLTFPTRAIYVGVTGDVKVDFAESGTAIVLKAMPVGWHPIRVVKIYSGGTSATNIVAGD